MNQIKIQSFHRAKGETGNLLGLLMTKYFVNRKYVFGNRCQIEACNWRFNAVIKTLPVTFYLIKEKIYNLYFFFFGCNNNIIHITDVKKNLYLINLKS